MRGLTSVRKRLIIAVGVGLAAWCTTTPAKAAVLTYSGHTTGQPTWLRTIVGNPPDQLSGQTPGEVGVIVPYSIYQFTVDQSGTYAFGSAVPGATSAIDGAWDNFLELYQDSFNPTDQLTNVLVAGNAPNNGSPVFTRQLTAGQNYFLVTTGRQASDFGAFTNTIAGPGDIINPPALSAFTYQGDTTDAPTWLRVAPGTPPNRVSGQAKGDVGAVVGYSVFEFTVDHSGLYNFASAVPHATSAVDGDWDNFLALYQDSFNPTDQLTHVLVAANAPNNGSLAFSEELSAGENYFLVTTGRQASEFGAFTNTIDGSGKVTAVPEPSSPPGILAAVGVSLWLCTGRRRGDLG